MKLRNKKTGEIATFNSDHNDSLADFGGKLLLEIQGKEFSYATLAELNEEWEDYTPGPDPGYTVAIIQKLENSVKELDERLKTVEEILKISGVGFCPIHNQDKPCKDCIGGIIEQIKAQEEEK